MAKGRGVGRTVYHGCALTITYLRVGTRLGLIHIRVLVFGEEWVAYVSIVAVSI
jgi:hypothetical protein